VESGSSGRAMIKHLIVRTSGQGLYEFTDAVTAVVREARMEEGLCSVFIRHTSASLLIQENADPSARRDLERWLKRLVPEDDNAYSHRSEGPDDMPAHIKAALTATSLGIPISDGRLVLGAWQGIYLWEHRDRGGAREIVVHVGR
jgi:secondary thiamine-phosphate synthase enzyme